MAAEPRSNAEVFVQERRDQLMDLIRHGDPFVRTCALAVLVAGGDEADLQTAQRELELLQEVGEEWR